MEKVRQSVTHPQLMTTQLCATRHKTVAHLAVLKAAWSMANKRAELTFELADDKL